MQSIQQESCFTTGYTSISIPTKDDLMDEFMELEFKLSILKWHQFKKRWRLKKRFKEIIYALENKFYQ